MNKLYELKLCPKTKGQPVSQPSVLRQMLGDDEGIESSVDDLRGELDGLVRDLVERADEPARDRGGVIE